MKLRPYSEMNIRAVWKNHHQKSNKPLTLLMLLENRTLLCIAQDCSVIEVGIAFPAIGKVKINPMRRYRVGLAMAYRRYGHHRFYPKSDVRSANLDSKDGGKSEMPSFRRTDALSCCSRGIIKIGRNSTE